MYHESIERFLSRGFKKEKLIFHPTFRLQQSKSV